MGFACKAILKPRKYFLVIVLWAIPFTRSRGPILQGSFWKQILIRWMSRWLMHRTYQRTQNSMVTPSQRKQQSTVQLMYLIRLSWQGDEQLKADLERRAIEYDPTTYWDSTYLSPNGIAVLNLARWDRQCRTPLYNPYQGNPAGRQLSESLPDFLARLPPLTTSISSLGSPWIWIANPYSAPRPLDQDLAALTINGTKILAELSTNLQDCMEERKQASLRGRAIKMILDVAITTGVTTGKWMLFPEARDVNSVWKVVADNTASGELGICAKVATGSGDMDGKTKQQRLVCVYTKDFSDGEDVRRVVRQMEILDLVPKNGPPWIYYKCGAFYFIQSCPSFNNIRVRKERRAHLNIVNSN